MVPGVRFDPSDAMADLAALFEAGSADELHRALVLGVSAHRANEPPVPVGLLRRVHAAGADRVGETVLLLATDPRWERAAGLMDAIAVTEVVDDEVLDLLARAFIQADEHVWWRCPDDWFDGEVLIELGDGSPVDDSSDGEVPEDEPVDAEQPADAAPTVVRRRLPPAVRRWAVRRALAGEPARWAAVHQRASAAPAKVAAPLLLGLLDSVGLVPPAARRVVIEAAMACNDATVRMAGLRHLATEDRGAAIARAAADPNSRVRLWGESLAVAAELPGRASGGEADADQVRSPADGGSSSQDGQGTLF